MTTWQCEVCGYIHSGDKPPASCPVCDAEQELFHLLEIPRESPAPIRADTCLLYTSPSPRDRTRSRMPSSA